MAKKNGDKWGTIIAAGLFVLFLIAMVVLGSSSGTSSSQAGEVTLDPSDLEKAELTITFVKEEESVREEYVPEDINSRVVIRCTITLPENVENIEFVDNFALSLKDISELKIINDWKNSNEVSTIFSYADFNNFNLLEAELVVSYNIIDSQFGYKTWGSIILNTESLQNTLSNFDSVANGFQIKIPIVLSDEILSDEQADIDIDIREKLYKIVFNPKRINNTNSYEFVCYLRNAPALNDGYQIEILNCYPPATAGCSVPDVTNQYVQLETLTDERGQEQPGIFLLKITDGKNMYLGYDGDVINTNYAILRTDLNALAFSTVRLEEIVPDPSKMYLLKASTGETSILKADKYTKTTDQDKPKGVLFSVMDTQNNIPNLPTNFFIRTPDTYPFSYILGDETINTLVDTSKTIINEILDNIYYTGKTVQVYTIDNHVAPCDISYNARNACTRNRIPTTFTLVEQTGSSQRFEQNSRPNL